LKEWLPGKGGRFHAIKEINPSITPEMRNVRKISPRRWCYQLCGARALDGCRADVTVAQ
jgi:hypothetical protein